MRPIDVLDEGSDPRAVAAVVAELDGCDVRVVVTSPAAPRSRSWSLRRQVDRSPAQTHVRAGSVIVALSAGALARVDPSLLTGHDLVGGASAARRLAGLAYQETGGQLEQISDDPFAVMSAGPRLPLDPDVALHSDRRTAAVPSIPDVRVDASDHVLFGPANYAGQGATWSRAVRRGGRGASNLQVLPRAVGGYSANHTVTGREWSSPEVRELIATRAVREATHVIVEAMRPLLGIADPTASAHGWAPDLAAADVLGLVSSGRQVALLFHGSEVRDPDRHAELDPASMFRTETGGAFVDRLRATTSHVGRLTATLRDSVQDLGVFVSTPDLLDYVAGAIWVPVTISAGSFGAASPVLMGKRPTVLHAPSNPLLKGSDVIDDVLTRLADDGLVHYRRVTGLPAMLMPYLLREVDVVVDQVVLGNPGVLAAEAMAAGRLVVAHVSAPVRSRFEIEPPIVEATVSTLEDVMRDICGDRERYAGVAALGPGFAGRFHDGSAALSALGPFLRKRAGSVTSR